MREIAEKHALSDAVWSDEDGVDALVEETEVEDVEVPVIPEYEDAAVEAEASQSYEEARAARDRRLYGKRRQPRPGDYSSPLTAQDRPNAVWAVDFKGWYRLATGLKCYPLTVSDGYSRYLLGCETLEHPDETACREAFERLFGQYGLPAVIRSDNGTPFSGRFGISTLSVWWI